jgi:hypothetical protein
MAKKITKTAPALTGFNEIPNKRLERDPNVPSAWDMQEKVTPRKYTSSADWEAPGKMGTLPAGSTFTECNDGFYVVHNPAGEKIFYRVGHKTVMIIIDKK